MGEPLLAPVLRLLEEGREREALALLQTPQEGLPEAERLALLGFLEGRKGDLRAYRALALEAAQRAQTPLTLYHLGLALPPKAGALALEEALRHRALPLRLRKDGTLLVAVSERPGEALEAALEKRFSAKAFLFLVTTDWDMGLPSKSPCTPEGAGEGREEP